MRGLRVLMEHLRMSVDAAPHVSVGRDQTVKAERPRRLGHLVLVVVPRTDSDTPSSGSCVVSVDPRATALRSMSNSRPTAANTSAGRCRRRGRTSPTRVRRCTTGVRWRPGHLPRGRAPTGLRPRTSPRPHPLLRGDPRVARVVGVRVEGLRGVQRPIRVREQRVERGGMLVADVFVGDEDGVTRGRVRRTERHRYHSDDVRRIAVGDVWIDVHRRLRRPENEPVALALSS